MYGQSKHAPNWNGGPDARQVADYAAGSRVMANTSPNLGGADRLCSYADSDSEFMCEQHIMSTDSFCEEHRSAGMLRPMDRVWLTKLMSRRSRRLLKLSGISFQDANLNELDLSQIDFSQTDFSRARLSNANFTGCNFRAARLDQVMGSDSIFDKCDLTQASARGAILGGSRLRYANCANAVFTDAQLFQLRLHILAVRRY